MGIYSDPTANAAIGTINKEYNKLKKLAEKIKPLQKQGALTPTQQVAINKIYRGIYSHLLDDDEDSEGGENTAPDVQRKTG